MATETNHNLHENAFIASDQTSKIGRAVFAIEGMTCASCAMRIEKGLKKVVGVRDANVNMATEQATVAYDPTQTGVEQMIQKVEAVGYKAAPLQSVITPAPQLNPTTNETGSAASPVPAPWALLHLQPLWLVLGKGQNTAFCSKGVRAWKAFKP